MKSPAGVWCGTPCLVSASNILVLEQLIENPTQFLILTVAASVGMIVHRTLLIVSVPLFADHILKEDSKELLLTGVLGGSD